MRRLAIGTGICAIASVTIYCGENLPPEQLTPTEAGVDGSIDSESIDTGPPDPCTADAPKGAPVAATGIKPTRVVTDGLLLFVSGGDKIERVSIVDQKATAFITANTTVNGLALNDGYLLFLNGSRLLYTAKGGTASQLDEALPAFNWQPVLTAQGVYGAGASAGSISTVQPPSTNWTTLFSVNNVTALAMYNNRVAFIGNAGAVPAVQTSLFGTNMRDLYDAGSATPKRIAIDPTHLYVADDGGNVWAIEIATNNRTSLATQQSTQIHTLRLHDNYVYFASSEGVRRVAKNGGCVQRVVDGTTADFDVTDAKVYWVNGADILGAPLP